MNQAKILQSISENTAVLPEQWGKNDQAAVLVALVEIQQELHFLFTKRTDFIATHKGQVSFPGGRADLSDANPIVTALRETNEEIGVHQDKIEVFGLMQEIDNRFGLKITPVVGVLDWPVDIVLSVDEVSRVFYVPVSWFLEERNLELRELPDAQGQAHPVIFFREYDGEVVWGLTARIIWQFLQLVMK